MPPLPTLQEFLDLFVPTLNGWAEILYPYALWGIGISLGFIIMAGLIKVIQNSFGHLFGHKKEMDSVSELDEVRRLFKAHKNY